MAGEFGFVLGISSFFCLGRVLAAISSEDHALGTEPEADLAVGS